MKKKSWQLLMLSYLIVLVIACCVDITWYKNHLSDDTDVTNNTNSEDESDNTEDEEINIWIMGDSLAAFSRNSESEGWGEGLDEYLKDENVVVKNTAMGGASSSSYLNSGAYQMVMDDLKEGDYVIVQFGINDAWYEDRHTDPFLDSKTDGSFKNILKNKYIEPIINKGAHVILSTSAMEPAAMFYGGEQQAVFYTPHVLAVRELTEECQEEGREVLLLDTYAVTQELYHEIGANESYKFHVADRIHYNNYGAYYIAGLIAKELKNLDIPCCQNIRTIEEVMADVEL